MYYGKIALLKKLFQKTFVYIELTGQFLSMGAFL